jgi:hypothetical protein
MKTLLTTSLLAILASTAVEAQELDITITNLTHGSHFTPLLVAAHAATTTLFEPGKAASANLQAMAEGGDISGLTTDVDAAGADKVANPAGGLLAPGASTSFSLSTSDGNDRLSVVAMVLPTNDGFVGMNSLSIPTAAGSYTYQINAWDAGTEANDEIVNGNGAPGLAGIPADPLGKNGSGGTGVAAVDDNGNIHIHRGVIGDTDPTGGPSDLDSRIHRWLNPVASISITVK